MSRLARILLAALSAVGLVSAAAACDQGEPETAVEAFDDEGEEVVEMVTGEPFEGTAIVDDVLGPHGFFLLDTLVVSEREVDVDEGDRVRVTGEVTTADDARDQLGDAVGDDVSDALAGEDLVVVASEVEIVEEDVE